MKTWLIGFLSSGTYLSVSATPGDEAIKLAIAGLISMVTQVTVKLIADWKERRKQKRSKKVLETKE